MQDTRYAAWSEAQAEADQAQPAVPVLEITNCGRLVEAASPAASASSELDPALVQARPNLVRSRGPASGIPWTLMQSQLWFASG